ncbi:MAG: hypothetical protein HYZ39_16105 [Mycolicibacterium cosmeticum]|nr:hypothetical protein [Mycolicibacterium cosmeticum]
MDEVSQSGPPRQPFWRSTAARVVVGLIAGALVIAVKVAVSHEVSKQIATNDARSDFAEYHVGDCIVMVSAGPENKADVRRSECATDPSYTVGAVYDNDRPCDNANYAGYDWVVEDKTVVRLCLVENLLVDHCYRTSPETQITELLDCAGAGGNAMRVVRRSDSIDTTTCPQDSDAYIYLSPPRSYCFAPVALPTWS